MGEEKGRVFSQVKNELRKFDFRRRLICVQNPIVPDLAIFVDK